MSEYLNRLKAMGFKAHEAVHILEMFHKYFNKEYLELFITSLENEHYVAEVQSKSHGA